MTVLSLEFKLFINLLGTIRLFCARHGLHRCKVQKKFYARVQSSKKYLCTNFYHMQLLCGVVT